VLRRLYRKVMELAASPRAPAWLALVAFAESSVFPIPPDAMLAPMVLARRDKAFTYAAICTAGSVAGGILGYAIGYYMQGLGRALLALLGHREGLQAFQQWYAHWGLWVILIKGLTPIPYKLVTITSGIARFDFPMFVAASAVTRGARFFLAAALIKRFGPQVEHVLEKRLYAVTGIALAVLVIGFIVVRSLH
jgi:membrane protein YqaA with SNARE-associated domain